MYNNPHNPNRDPDRSHRADIRRIGLQRRLEAQRFIEESGGISNGQVRPALDLCIEYLNYLRKRYAAGEEIFKDCPPFAGLFRDSKIEIDGFLAGLPDAAMDAIFFGDLRPGGQV